MKYKKNILVVTSRYPLPVRGGDKLRIVEIMKYLSKENCVDLISIGNYQKKVNFINKQFIFKNGLFNQSLQMINSFFNNEPLQIGLFKNSNMKNKIDIISKNYDVIIFHLIRTTYYIPTGYNGKKILEMTDLISKNYGTIEKNMNNLNPLKFLYKFEKKRLEKFEKINIKKFDWNIFVNKKDLKKSYINNNKKKGLIKFIGNGTELKEKIYSKKITKNNLIFFGNINSLANRSACIDFIKNFLPTLKLKYPQLKFIILGNCSVLLKIFFKFLGVTVYSNIKNLSDHSQHSLAGICNVKIQSGLQNKILDYTSLGIPVLANKISNNFEFLTKQDLLIYNDDQDFFIKLDKLKNNKKFRTKISSNCYLKTRKHYKWNDVLKEYSSII